MHGLKTLPPVVAWLLLVTLASVDCHAGPVRQSTPAAEVMLRADSMQYTVTFMKPFYHAAIGYVYTNRTQAPVSANYCKVPRGA